MGSCEGRVAFVTGASRGIGKAIATRLAAEGASVVSNASRMGAHGDLVGTLEESTSAIQAAKTSRAVTSMTALVTSAPASRQAAATLSSRAALRPVSARRTPGAA